MQSRLHRAFASYVRPGGLEPPTSCMSSMHSNQLSYGRSSSREGYDWFLDTSSRQRFASTQLQNLPALSRFGTVLSISARQRRYGSGMSRERRHSRIQKFFACTVLLAVLNGCSALPNSLALPWGGPPEQWEPENWTSEETEEMSEYDEEDVL